MATNYVVTAKKPTVVTDALVGNFTGPDDLNLILARVNRIEVHVVTAEGLRAVREVPLFGRIASIQLFRVEGENVDSIVIVTEKYHLSILSWKDGDVISRASGHIADKVGRPADTGLICCVHQSGLLAFRIYDGMLKIVHWDDGKEMKAFNIRFEDLAVIDITFLYGHGDTIRMAYIYQDGIGRHLKTVELNVTEKEMKTISTQESIESEANILIPVPLPYGGVIVVGQETLIYNREDNTYITISPPNIHNAHFTCFAKIDPDGQRFLLSGLSGDLLMLLLDVDPTTNTVAEMKVEFLGRTSIPQCLVYLDNGVVFIGSRFGDSQLIKLNTEPDSVGSFVTVLESFPNLGPIRDMALMDNGNGQTQLITCSGAYKDGSLRIIRNGIGIEELASVDVKAIKGLFPLRIGDSEYDNYLVMSTFTETHVLKIDGEELEDTELFGMELGEKTIYAGCLSDGYVIQVTRFAVRVYKEGKEAELWKANDGELSCCAVNEKSGQIVVAAGCNLHYLRTTDGNIEELGFIVMPNEAACLDISPIDGSSESTLVAIALWKSNDVSLLTLPHFKQVANDQLAEKVLPRSCLLEKFDDTVYLLVALGDGTLYYFQVRETDEEDENGIVHDLAEGKRACLGTQPIYLRKFVSNRKTHVFVCSDRPAIIYSSNNKLVFSNVNVKAVSQMCSLNSEVYNNCLVMADSENMSIGRVDDIQKLHIRTVPLGESPSRVALLPESAQIALLTSRQKHSDMMTVSRSATRSSRSTLTTTSRGQDASDCTEIHSVVILDQNTFEVLHSHELGPYEEAISILGAHLADDSQEYLVVGTAIVYEDEAESKMGRILIFECGKGEERCNLRLIHEKEIKGAAFSLATLQGKLLVAVNSSVRLFEWIPDKELRLECSHFQYITALYLKTKGDIVLVGDLMRSMGLLSYKPMESSFEEIARDAQSHWMSAIEIIDSDTFLGAESSYNLFTTERERSASSKEERQKMIESGVFYLGDHVNVFRAGSLVTQHVDGGFPCEKSILFGTVEGEIGVIMQLPSQYFRFAKDVEKAVAAKTENVMRIDHATYRQFYTEKQVLTSFGFVDGDLVESLLDIPREQAREIVKDVVLPGTVDEESLPENVLKLVEDLSRVH